MNAVASPFFEDQGNKFERAALLNSSIRIVILVWFGNPRQILGFDPMDSTGRIRTYAQVGEKIRYRHRSSSLWSVEPRSFDDASRS